jgi:hypothetical protein
MDTNNRVEKELELVAKICAAGYDAMNAASRMAIGEARRDTHD